MGSFKYTNNVMAQRLNYSITNNLYLGSNAILANMKFNIKIYI